MSYLRNKTRPQGDRPIKHNQDNFGGGINSDDPATDIDNNEVIDAENYIFEERFARGRTGTIHVGTFPTGDFECRPVYHPKEKCLLFHKGTKLYRWDGASPVELLDYPIAANPPASFGLSNPSQIKIFGDNAILFLGNADIYFLLIKGGLAKFFPMNTYYPYDVPLLNNPATANLKAPYKYKYAYTFSLIITEATGAWALVDRLASGVKIIWESPPFNPSVDASNPDTSYFRVQERTAPISSGSLEPCLLGALDNARIDGGGNWLLGSVSHFSIYRTVDYGQNGIDDEFTDQFAWIGDQPIGPASPATSVFYDGKTDLEVAANLLQANLRLNNIGWVPMRGIESVADATAAFGRITEQFVFVANKNQKTLHYSQRVDDNKVGFHAGFQSHEFDDGIRVMGSTPDILSVFCNNSTHIVTLTSIVNAGILQSDFILDHFDEIDDVIGVQDEGSFVEVEQGTYIALCSDRSIRVWQGNGWSRDLSFDKVNGIIGLATPGITQAVYSDGAYLIWMDTNGGGVVDTCLRLSVKRSSGKGWTRYSGDSWVLPKTFGNGTFNADSFLTAGGIGVNMTFVVETDDECYWIETFNGPPGKTINTLAIQAVYNDKVTPISDGVAIQCRAKTREITGSQESFNIIHQESHGYMRDTVDPDKNTLPTPQIISSYGDLKIDARAYVNGSLTPVETEGEVDPGNDIQFWYRVTGDRISIEFQSNRSGHQLRRIDSRFRVQDILRPGRGPYSNVSSVDFQADFQDGLQLWMFTRPSPYLDRVRKRKISSNGVTLVTAPDNRNSGVTLTGADGGAAPYIKPNTVVFDAFTYNVWIKTPVLDGSGSTVLLKVNGGAQALTITLSGVNAVATVEFGGSVVIEDPTTATGNVNGWSQLMFVRVASASTMNVYQNDILKGTLPVNTTFGGGNLEIGAVI